ncbi:hypothetical protein MPSEU_000508300 [Mayamaea pseudoterrestris]|nr:hypothetical protein MPSEU_000508300 [Mayamaea pseudoterrestris]
MNSFAASSSDFNSSSSTAAAAAAAAPSDRFAWHEELRVYEAKRKLKYSSKLDSCQLYYKSHRQLLEDGVNETKRAHRLTLGLAQAQKILANSLRTKKHVKRTRKNVTKLGFLDSLNESTDAIKTCFVESSHQVMQVDEKIKALIQEIMDGILHLTERGKSILELMEKTQNDTTDAWDAYYESVKTVETAANPALLASPNLRTSAAPSATTEVKTDPWLAELTYRSRVQLQLTTWETALEQLSRLFSQAQQLECHRRTQLREYMIDMWTQQGNTMQAAEASHEAPLVDWGAKPTAKEEVEMDVKEIIDKLSRAVEGLEDVNDDSIHTHFDTALAEQNVRDTKDVQPLSDRLSVFGFYEDLFTTGLHSDYVKHVSVVEVIRKTDILRSNYALCVVTIDAMMHLFWLQKKPDTPEEAFGIISSRFESHEHEGTLLQPDETIALTAAKASASATGNKVDLSTSKKVIMSLISATREEQMMLCDALGGGE